MLFGGRYPTLREFAVGRFEVPEYPNQRVGEAACGPAIAEILPLQIVQRFVDAADQRLTVEWFAQEASGSGGHGARSVSFFRVGCDKDDRCAVTLVPQPLLQRETIHARHLHVHDQTPALMDRRRLQKILGGCKRIDD
jgi:hypothetical protein